MSKIYTQLDPVFKKIKANADDTNERLGYANVANATQFVNMLGFEETISTVPVWEQGYISYLTGINVESAKNVRSLPIAIIPQSDFAVSPGDYNTYQFKPFWYDIQMRYIGEGGKRSTGTTYVIGTSAPANTAYVRFTVSRIDGAEFTPDEAVFINYVRHNSNPFGTIGKNDEIIEILQSMHGADLDLSNRLYSFESPFLIDGSAIEWEQGGINSSNGAFTVNEKACRTLPISILPGANITIRSGDISTYKFRPSWYDSEMKWIRSGGIRSTNHKYIAEDEIPENVAYLLISVVRADGAAFTPTEATFIANVEHEGNPLSPISQIPDHETRITSLETVIASSVVPSYFQTQLDTKIPTIIENANTAGKTGETFIFITDIHWETNYKNSPALIDYILKHTNINLLIGGGDLVNEGQKAAMYANLIDCVKHFQFPLANNFFPSARGNHDDNSNWASQADVETYAFDYNTVYALMYNQIAPLMGVKFFTDTEHSFYFDREASKTRFLVLDTARNSTFAAFDELAQVLNETPDGYSIIIVEHFIYGNGYIRPTFRQVMNVVAAYNGRTTVTVSNTYDFTNAGGKIQCIFAGHTHSDMSWAIGADGNVSGVPIIVTDTDSYRNHSGTEGTVNSQCFDVVSVDYVGKTVKCTRIGRGEDRTFALPQ